MANPAYRSFNIPHDDSVAAFELLAVQIHMIAKDARVYRSGDLGRAGGFGAVAHDSRDNGEGVDNRMNNFLIAAPAQVGDSRTGSGPGAYCSAIGRQRPDGLPSDSKAAALCTAFLFRIRAPWHTRLPAQNR